ncbi:MAG: Gfo/Idh/MocA family oxidoreductase [Clostridiaceae bacterium]|nr:Gfo/Idh/MocA family oxidoreductase [Clostridiaceae bacterium]
MKKLKAAVVGIGSIGINHVKALHGMGIELAWLIDLDLNHAKTVAAEYDATNYSTDFADVLDSDVDCIHLCTPPNLHYDQMTQILNRGFNVLCEKPLCFEDQQAMELYQLARKHNCLTAIDFNVRFHLALTEVKSIIESEDFGAVRLIHGSYLQEFHAFPAPLDWRYNKELAGNMRAMTEIGSHWTDLAQYLSGKKITALSARFANFSPERDLHEGMMFEKDSISVSDKITVESEDAVILNMLFEDGVIGSCILSEVSAGRINRLAIEITGSRKNIWWNSEDNNVINIGMKNAGINTFVYPFGNSFGDTLGFLFKAFYKDIQRGYADENSRYPTLYDGMRNVLICNAAYTSATNQGKWVEIKI